MQWQTSTRYTGIYSLIPVSLRQNVSLSFRSANPNHHYSLLEMTVPRDTSDVLGLERSSEEPHYDDMELKGSDSHSNEVDTKGLKHGILQVDPTATLRTAGGADVDDDNPLYVRNLVYSREEEAAVIRILDTRLFPWILLTTFVLNMDRTNNSNAISDNLPGDLGFNINVVNTATAIYSVLFSIFCLTGAVIAKIAGPSRCTYPIWT